MPEDQKKGNHTEIAENSLARSREIESILFSSAQNPSDPISPAFIFVTRDIQNGLVSAPITNIEYSALKTTLSDLGGEGATVLSAFRREALPSTRKGGGALSETFILRLSGKVGGVGKAAVGACYLVEVTAAGRPKRIIEFGVGDPREVTRGAWRNELMDHRARKFLDAFYGMAGGSGARFLFFRKGVSNHDEHSGRGFQLFQTGFVVVGRGTRLPDHKVLGELALRGATSEFASLAILLEKERYYEKAARQAVRGEMVKLHRLSAVAEEVRALEGLRSRGRRHVPQVRSRDRAIDICIADPNREVSETDAWYSMEKFILPTLANYFTSVEGFHDFELQTIVASTLEHLEHTYWSKEDGEAPKTKVREHLCALLAFAHSRMDDTVGAFEERAAAMEKRRPVKIGGKVGFFEQTDWSLVTRLIPALRAETAFPVSIEWMVEGEPTTYENGYKCFEALWSAVAEVADVDRFRIAQVKNPHGDAHFGNIMIDASIPEDPLVVSIDQGSGIFREDQVNRIKHWLSEKINSGESFGGVFGSGAIDVARILKQPALHEERGMHYDFAKLMMSASCVYPIALRGGTTVEIREEADGSWQFVIGKSEGKPEELRESGGVSGAQIVRVDAPVPDDAWFYHGVAAKLITARFVKLLEEREGMDERSVVLGLVCLWLLTLRHSFSIAEILFPRNIPAAVTMLLMSLRLLNRGREAVILAIQGEKGEGKEKLLEVFEINPPEA